MELNILDLEKICISVVEKFNFNNNLICEPYYLTVHEFDNYVNNKEFNIINKLNFILSKEKRKKYIKNFLLCKNKSNNKKFIIAASCLFSKKNISSFDII